MYVYNTYSYDDIDRLTGVTYHDSDTEGFLMDDLGNRSGDQTLRDDGTVNFAVDTLTNRYTAVGGSSLAYDDAGNLTTDKDGYAYIYDYENRIVKIKDDQQTPIAEFAYDTQGRRIRVSDLVAGTDTLYYYSDHWQVLAEYDGSDTFQAYYVFGNYIDEALLMHRDAADKFYLHDHLYSPVAMTDSSGAVVERYEYDAYGKATIWDSTFSNSYSVSQYGNYVLFTGREVDELDNGNLILQYNRNRYLSQYMGCWFTHDPLEYVDGLNLYEYGTSRPIMLFDPFGYNYAPPSSSLSITGYQIMKTSNEEPINTYHGVALDRFLDYGIHKEWLGKEKSLRDWVKDVHIRTVNTINNWEARFPMASKFLNHYLANVPPSGSEIIGNRDIGALLSVYKYDHSELISKSREVKNEANRHAQSVANYINNNPILWHGLSVRTSNAVGSSYSMMPTDQFLSIAGHAMWHKAENIRCNNNVITADFTLNLWDVYDFEGTDWGFLGRAVGAEVDGYDLASMHALGQYRAFFVYGKTTKKISWHRDTNLWVWFPF